MAQPDPLSSLMEPLPEPAPNRYTLPKTVGHERHDPSKWRSPAYTMGAKLDDRTTGLGPGFYNVGPFTRFGPSQGPRITMAPKLPDFMESVSPGPVYYHAEKCRLDKDTPPKFTMARRTPVPTAVYAPAANSYRLPSTLGPRVPDKPCNGAFTMGSKMQTPRGDGVPAPNKYGPVRPNTYKTAGAQYTMGHLTSIPKDKTQKPSPNTYLPKVKNKLREPKFSFGRRAMDSRIIYLTQDDVKQ